MSLHEYNRAHRDYDITRRHAPTPGVCQYLPCDTATEGERLYCSKAHELKTHRHRPLTGWEQIEPDPYDVREAQVRRGQKQMRGTCTKCANTIVGGAGTCHDCGRYACDARGCDGCVSGCRV